MTLYKLPDGIRDGEIEAEEIWGGCAGGRPEYRLAGGFTLLAPAGQPLERVKPPLPEEPPYKTVVLDDDGQAWQRFAPAVGDPLKTSEWSCAGGAADEDWAGLNAYGPLTRLVPDPFAEPVELPWRSDGVDVQPTTDDGRPGPNVYVSTKRASYGFAHVRPSVARAMARALWAAADQAERAS